MQRQNSQEREGRRGAVADQGANGQHKSVECVVKEHRKPLLDDLEADGLYEEGWGRGAGRFGCYGGTKLGLGKERNWRICT